MPTPLEIVAVPFEVWVGPIGEAFPAINATPAGNWVKLGTRGALNIREPGVTVSHGQTVELVRMSGDTLPIKAFRTEEDIRISFTLSDLTLENYNRAVNMGSVTDTAAGSGVAGHRAIDLRQGLDVEQRALLIRGANASPYLASTNVQYEVPVAVQVGTPSAVYSKGEPVGLEMEWAILVDLNAATAAKRAGVLRMMDENPT